MIISIVSSGLISNPNDWGRKDAIPRCIIGTNDTIPKKHYYIAKTVHHYKLNMHKKGRVPSAQGIDTTRLNR